MLTNCIITDEEFEKKNWYEQRDYRYCPKCNHYYKVDNPCLCKLVQSNINKLHESEGDNGE